VYSGSGCQSRKTIGTLCNAPFPPKNLKSPTPKLSASSFSFEPALLQRNLIIADVPVATTDSPDNLLSFCVCARPFILEPQRIEA
jgi:hypothetical protein